MYFSGNYAENVACGEIQAYRYSNQDFSSVMHSLSSSAIKLLVLYSSGAQCGMFLLMYVLNYDIADEIFKSIFSFQKKDWL